MVEKAFNQSASIVRSGITTKRLEKIFSREKQWQMIHAKYEFINLVD